MAFKLKLGGDDGHTTWTNLPNRGPRKILGWECKVIVDKNNKCTGKNKNDNKNATSKKKYTGTFDSKSGRLKLIATFHGGNHEGAKMKYNGVVKGKEFSGTVLCIDKGKSKFFFKGLKGKIGGHVKKKNVKRES